jgi:phospholipid-binding lipoprotein MlaA
MVLTVIVARRALALVVAAGCVLAAPARADRTFSPLPVPARAARGGAPPAIAPAPVEPLAEAPPCQVAEAAAPPNDTADAPPSESDAFELEGEEHEAGFPDPYERTNRALLWLDEELTRWVVDPITDVYQLVVPDPARKAVRRFFLNLDTPSVLVNNILQREWRDAGITVERFALNTVIGMGGLFDPAAQLGLPRHDSDFGQTLALTGVPSGPYLVLPFFGPSNARDAFGGLVDLALQPTLYILPFGTLIIYESSLGLSARDAHSEAIEMLRESAVDYYSALRNAYYQNRTAHIWEHREAHRPEPDGALAGPMVADR